MIPMVRFTFFKNHKFRLVIQVFTRNLFNFSVITFKKIIRFLLFTHINEKSFKENIKQILMSFFLKKQNNRFIQFSKILFHVSENSKLFQLICILWKNPFNFFGMIFKKIFMFSWIYRVCLKCLRKNKTRKLTRFFLKNQLFLFSMIFEIIFCIP